MCVPKKIPPSSSSDEDSDESPTSMVRSGSPLSSCEIDEEEDEADEVVGWSSCMAAAGVSMASIVSPTCDIEPLKSLAVVQTEHCYRAS